MAAVTICSDFGAQKNKIKLKKKVSPPTSQFKSINSSALSPLYSPTLISVHDYWKTYSFDYVDLWWQSDISVFNMLSRFVIAFSPKEQASFNFMAAVTICSDFGAPLNKIWLCFPIYLSWSDATGCHDLRFLNVELYANFFTLHFHFHQEAF